MITMTPRFFLFLGLGHTIVNSLSLTSAFLESGSRSSTSSDGESPSRRGCVGPKVRRCGMVGAGLALVGLAGSQIFPQVMPGSGAPMETQEDICTNMCHCECPDSGGSTTPYLYSKNPPTRPPPLNLPAMTSPIVQPVPGVGKQPAAPGEKMGVWAFKGSVNGKEQTLYAVGNEQAQQDYLEMLPNGFRINGVSRDGAKESRFYVVKHAPEFENGAIKRSVLEPWKLGEGSNVVVTSKRGNPDDNNCNAAFYLVGMPGDAPGTNNDWYCDANSVGGNTCWEQDITESTSATISTSHPWGDGGGSAYANGPGYQEATITYRDGKTISGPVGEGTGADLGAGEGAALVTSLWYCDGWPGMPPSSPDKCTESSTVDWVDWVIQESQ